VNTLLIAMQFDFMYLLPFAAFFAIACGAWAIGDFMVNRRSKTEIRLDKLRAEKNRDKKSSTKKEGFTQFLEKASPAFAKPLQPKNEKEAGKLRQKLVHAGFRTADAMTIFLGIKFVMLIVGLVVGGGTSLILAGLTQKALFGTLIAGGVFFFLPDLALGFIGKGRKEKVFLSLPDALDMLVVCVEAGLGLDQAMRRVADEMEKTAPVLAFEFATCNMQMQMGKTRESVLTELGDRSGVDDLKQLASIIIQADKFGSSIAKALRVQSEAMRTKRRQIAEEKASKTAVKLLFPLVLFIFPGIFAVLVGPAAITVVNEMLPAFQK
jgi:tight adherence protein C